VICAGDVTGADIGAEISWSYRGVEFYGTLRDVKHRGGMVSMHVEAEGEMVDIVFPIDKPVSFQLNHVRKRALSEADADLRRRFLLEYSHLGTLQLLAEIPA
jgi:hypothetical protein